MAWLAQRCARVYNFTTMQSKLAQQARLAAIAATQLLTPEERLNAFLAHCQLMVELHEAGKNLGTIPPPVRKS